MVVKAIAVIIAVVRPEKTYNLILFQKENR
jgi:hypothetical protein